MGASWTCSGGTWAADIAAKNSENRRASVTDASTTPSSPIGASWTCSGGIWAAALAAKSSEKRRERASLTQAPRPAQPHGRKLEVQGRHLGRRPRGEEQRE
eukprot:scaffold88523_cov51-Phaeocystis_antarctica.AAC.1